MYGDRPVLHVVAGVVKDPQGRVLITQRPPGKSLAGQWEFPGGKRATGESRFEALKREFAEELDLVVEQARPLIRYRHDYPDISVDLDVWQIQAFRGEPTGLERQAIDWVSPDALMAHDLLPADRPVTLALQLPERHLITGQFASTEEFETRLQAALESGIRLVQLRLPGRDIERVALLAARASRLCRAHAARLVINGEPDVAAKLAVEADADGIHLPCRYLSGISRRPVPDDLLLGASCHDRAELTAAFSLGADYALLSPVRPTSSHPGRECLGWARFAELVADLPLPVYALGGMSNRDLEDAWQAGAVGVAAISAFW